MALAPLPPLNKRGKFVSGQRIRDYQLEVQQRKAKRRREITTEAIASYKIGKIANPPPCDWSQVVLRRHGRRRALELVIRVAPVHRDSKLRELSGLGLHPRVVGDHVILLDDPLDLVATMHSFGWCSDVLVDYCLLLRRKPMSRKLRWKADQVLAWYDEHGYPPAAARLKK